MTRNRFPLLCAAAFAATYVVSGLTNFTGNLGYSRSVSFTCADFLMVAATRQFPWKSTHTR